MFTIIIITISCSCSVFSIICSCSFGFTMVSKLDFQGRLQVGREVGFKVVVYSVDSVVTDAPLEASTLEIIILSVFGFNIVYLTRPTARRGLSEVTSNVSSICAFKVPFNSILSIVIDTIPGNQFEG